MTPTTPEPSDPETRTAPFTTLEVALADEILSQRAVAKKTQDQLAHDAGLHRMVYIRVETAKRHASIAQVAKIAAALGTSTSRLIAKAEERERERLDVEERITTLRPTATVPELDGSRTAGSQRSTRGPQSPSRP